MLVLSMLMTGLVSVSAAGAAAPTDKNTATATLNVYKYKAGTAVKDGGVNIFGQETYNYDNAVPVTGATFTAYPVLYLNNKGTYSVSQNFSAADSVLDMSTILDGVSAENSASGYLTYGSTDNLEKTRESLEAYIRARSTASATKDLVEYYNATTNATGLAQFSDVYYGVYLVVETGVPEGDVASKSFLVAINADSVDENDEVFAYPKGNPISVDKAIVKDNIDVYEDTVETGELVEYKITSTIPSYDLTTIKNYYKDANNEDLPYYFTDTFSSAKMKFKDGSLKVMVRKSADSDTYYDVTELFTVEETDSKTIVFNTSYQKIADFGWLSGGIAKNDDDTIALNSDFTRMGAEIVLTYKAYLGDETLAGQAYSNKIEVSFANDPASYAGDPKVTTVPGKHEPVIYTYALELTKKFNGLSSTGYNSEKTDIEKVNPENVTFNILREEKNEGTAIQFIKTVTEKKVGDAEATVTVGYRVKGDMVVVNENVPSVSTTEKDGVTTTTTVTKTVVTDIPVGANDKILFRGLGEGTYYVHEKTTDQHFTLLTADVKLTITPVETDKRTADYTYNAGANSNVTTGTTGTSGLISMTLNNVRKQFDLPLTGGLGVWLFTIGGGIIMACGIIVITLFRKKSKEN